MHFFIVSIRRIILQISFISLLTLHLLYVHVLSYVYIYTITHILAVRIRFDSTAIQKRKNQKIKTLSSNKVIEHYKLYYCILVFKNESNRVIIYGVTIIRFVMNISLCENM